MSDWDDDVAWCGECGDQLEPVTPWKHNPCENSACPSTFRGLMADLNNTINDVEPGFTKDRLRQLQYDISDAYYARTEEE